MRETNGKFRRITGYRNLAKLTIAIEPDVIETASPTRPDAILVTHRLSSYRHGRQAACDQRSSRSLAPTARRRHARALPPRNGGRPSTSREAGRPAVAGLPLAPHVPR
jgi:hypothetical protein